MRRPSTVAERSRQVGSVPKDSIPGSAVWALIAAMLLVACGGSVKDAGPANPTSPFLSDRFLNIAHRGGARLRPEHTLVAYDHALAIGADVIEFDLHATSDGVIVILHDVTVDRTTDGRGAVRQMTFAELRQLDAGYRFTRDGGQTFPWRGQGLTIPTLEEALDRFQGKPLSVEIKQREPAIATRVVEIFLARGIVDTAVFAAFPTEPIQQLRARAPSAMTAMTANELIEFSLLSEATLETYMPPARFIQPPRDAVTPELLAQAHALGLKMHPWTVNNDADMRTLIQMGVDGMFTDDPVLLNEVLVEMGVRR